MRIVHFHRPLILAVLLLVFASATEAASPKAVASDPVGDTTRPGPDITRFSADVIGGNLVMTIDFAGSISPPFSGRGDELLAALALDTNGNHTDGFVDFQQFCGAVAGFGPDVLILLSLDSPSVSAPAVFDGASDRVLGYASAGYSNNSVTVSVALSLIGGGAVPILVGVGVAPGTENNSPQADDCAPDGQPLVAQAATQGPPVQVTGTTQAGANLTFRAPVVGVRYDWDLDGDGVVDRIGSNSSLQATYPGAYSGNVSVFATGDDGARTVSTIAISNAAPQLAVTLNGSPTQVCGDGDNQPEPGETWNVPVRITNQGTVATSGGNAAFAAQDRVDAASAGQGIDGKLIVQTPLLDVGNLAPGAAVTGTVSVTLANDAVCGIKYGLLFSGGVDSVSSSAGQSAPLTNITLPPSGQCQIYTGGCASAPGGPKAIVTPRQGLYYNVNRSGNGLSNFIIPVAGAAPIYFGAWFTGAADHTPTWYVIQGPLVGNVVVGPIYRFTRDVAASTFSVRSTVVGQAVVTMKSTERIALLWQMGSKSGIELMDYLVPGAAPVPNRTGAWYNAGESGWGQVIHSFPSGGQNYVFAVDYLYDGAGEPRWVLAQGTDAELSAGAAHATYRVHCPGCPWIGDWNSFPLASGTGSEVFLDATNGRATTMFTFPTPLSGTWTRANLPITLLTVPQ